MTSYSHLILFSNIQCDNDKIKIMADVIRTWCRTWTLPYISMGGIQTVFTVFVLTSTVFSPIQPIKSEPTFQNLFNMMAQIPHFLIHIGLIHQKV